MAWSMPPILFYWPSFSSSGSQWDTGGQQLVFLPGMNFRSKCQQALKPAVDLSSKFDADKPPTDAVGMINMLYVFPF